MTDLQDAFTKINSALVGWSRLTTREIYSINKLKRAWHKVEVRIRKLRKKHSKVRGRKAKK